MNKILLPVDGSKRSLRTVEMVQRLCDPPRATSPSSKWSALSCTSTP